MLHFFTPPRNYSILHTYILTCINTKYCSKIACVSNSLHLYLHFCLHLKFLQSALYCQPFWFNIHPLFTLHYFIVVFFFFKEFKRKLEARILLCFHLSFRSFFFMHALKRSWGMLLPKGSRKLLWHSNYLYLKAIILKKARLT